MLCSWAGTVSYGIAASHISADGCPFRLVTGFDCPGCGGTRAVLCLVHGRLIGALHYNAFLVLVPLAYLTYAASRLAGYSAPPRLRALLGRNTAMVVSALVVIGWTIFRNIPQFAWFNTSWAND